MQKIDRQVAFTGTKDVVEPLRFEPARLEAYMAREAPGFAGPLKVQQFKGGQSNPTYLLETPARKYVLRRKPPGKLLPSAHAVDREFRVIQALTAKRFPVAEPVLYCADESVTGTPFYVMGFVDGRVFWNPEMPGSNPRERGSIYDVMVATLARLHLERLIEWRPAHIPPSGPVRLVHGDYRLDNMIFDTGSTRVLAVLDWELSTLGDALADFSYHLMAWHMPPEETGAGTGSLVGHDLKALGIPSATDYVEMYHARTGFDPRPQLSTYLAYNFFRIAAILQGIAGRVRDGTATNEHAPAKAQMVRPLAETAWRFAREAGAR